MGLGKRFYKISKWIHKYPGLLLLLFLAWMSLSGVLLNHPIVIRSVSVPGFLVPKHYHPENWNRSTLKSILCLDSNNYFAYGNQGLYHSADKGKTFEPFMDGRYPGRPWKRRTSHLVYHAKTNQLLAATNNGLFTCHLDDGIWSEIRLRRNYEPVKKVLFNGDTCIAVAKSAIYTGNVAQPESFIRRNPRRAIDNAKMPLFRAFLKIHDGSIWGIPGKLLWDIFGLTLFFLCLSAFYIWFYPKKWKRQYKKKGIRSLPAEKKKRSFYLKNHKKLGWYVFFFLIIIFTTGMFLRPPLLISIARKSIDKKYLPAIKNKNPWHHKISNALYDTKNNKLVIECTDGIWTGDIFSDQPFEESKLPIRIFAMGATVFEEEESGKWLIGSFGGLDLFSLADSTSHSLLKQAPSRNPGRPGSILVTGYVQLPDSTHFVLGHYKGLCNLEGVPQPNALPMPVSIRKKYKMPFWNFLFELHNARIFKGILGGLYILIIPLGGIIGLLILFSGLFDYWYLKLRKN